MEKPLSRDELRELHRITQEAALKAYPNPGREGCPGTDILRDVAKLKWPADNLSYEHIKYCSPCLRDMLLLAELGNKRRHQRTLIGIATAAAALAATVVLLLFHTSHRPDSSYGNPAACLSCTHASTGNQAATSSRAEGGSVVPVVIALDLHAAGPERGVTSEKQVPPQLLPQAPVALSVNLPWGSDKGQYRVCIQKGSKVLAAAFGSAQIGNGSTILHVSNLNLSHVPAGPYTLRCIHADQVNELTVRVGS